MRTFLKKIYICQQKYILLHHLLFLLKYINLRIRDMRYAHRIRRRRMYARKAGIAGSIAQDLLNEAYDSASIKRL